MKHLLPILLFLLSALNSVGQNTIVCKHDISLTQQQLDEVKTDKALVTFHAYNEAKYAFDDYKEAYTANSDWRAKFQKIDGYRVPSKAIAAGKTDKVIAALTIKSDDIIADSIQFVTGTGTRFEYEKMQDGRYAISLIGGPAGDAQEIYAVVKNKQGDYITAGKLLLVSYTEQHRKVVLVPVNGTMPDKAAVEKRLNEIYNPVCISWTVSVDKPFANMSWSKDGNGILNVEGSGMFSTLTDEMKALNAAYGKDRTIDAGTAYLFILKQGKGEDKLLQGDMPRGKQFGYIFTNSGNIENTIAHELGHGIYQLQHTFDIGFSDDDLADNLMNYKGGTTLARPQWDMMHDKGLVIGVFEGDEDGMIVRNFKIDYGNYNYGGGIDVLNYLLKNNTNLDKLIKQRNYLSLNENGRMGVAIPILLQFFNDKIQFGDPVEAYHLLDKYVELRTLQLIAEKQNEIEKLIQKNGVDNSLKEGGTLHSYITNMLYGTFGTLNLLYIIQPIIDDVTQYYQMQYNVSLKVGAQQIRGVILNALQQGNISNALTKNGIPYLLSSLSNSKLKDLMRTKFPNISNKEIQEIINLKNAGKPIPKVSQLITKLTAKDISQIIGKMDDIHLSNLGLINSTFTPEISKIYQSEISILTKRATQVNSVIGVLAFTQLMNHVKQGASPSPGDIIGMIPHPVSFIYGWLINDYSNKQEEEFYQNVFATGIDFRLITTWNEKWKGRNGLPNEPMYLIYTDETEKINPKIIPTGFITQDKKLQKEIFGFEAKYINYNVRSSIKILDNEVRFIPQAQVLINN